MIQERHRRKRLIKCILNPLLFPEKKIWGCILMSGSTSAVCPSLLSHWIIPLWLVIYGLACLPGVLPAIWAANSAAALSRLWEIQTFFQMLTLKASVREVRCPLKRELCKELFTNVSLSRAAKTIERWCWHRNGRFAWDFISKSKIKTNLFIGYAT